MEILGIGPLEALFILVLAIIFVGPRELGRTARSVGRFLNQLYRSDAWRNLSEASRNLRTLPNRLAREAALEELEQVRDDIREEIDDLDQVRRGIRDEVGEVSTDLNAVSNPRVRPRTEEQAEAGREGSSLVPEEQRETGQQPPDETV